MNPRNFFAELKRRNVYKVAVAYVLFAWALSQGLAQLLPVFEIPNWTVRLLIVLLILGFPVALIFAWAFEITREGIKRTDEVNPAESIRQHAGRKLIAVTIALAAVAIAVTLFHLPHPVVPQQPIVATNSNAAKLMEIPAKSVAVLPFENLSSDKENAYFGDGIQDEILTKLASIADLKVISRTSTAKYKSKPEDLKTVSQQLGVATVLEGSVQKSGDKVRVNVQLIDARADAHLWAKSYDRSLQDLFAVESEVAQEIADSLRAKLSPSEINVLAQKPTTNTAAYDLFLKGEYEVGQGNSSRVAEWFRRAEAHYREALALDPNFALAAAHLAESGLARHWYLAPLPAAELSEVRLMVDRALELAPDSPEPHVAAGMLHYTGYRDYEPALAQFRRALDLQPNHAAARKYCAYIYRRQAQWERALVDMVKSEELDPRDADVPGNIALTHVILRQWNEAKRAAARSLAIDSHNVLGIRSLTVSQIYGDGDIHAAKRSVVNLDPVRATFAPTRGSFCDIVGYRAYVKVLDRDFAGALRDWETQPTGSVDHVSRLCAKLAIHLVGGDPAEARAEGDEALPLIEERLRGLPDDAFTIMQLAWAHLTLGRETDALRAARRAAELLPIEKDAVGGAAVAAGAAEIEARAGRAHEAATTLQRLLAIPAGLVVSLNRLKLDPVWDPIRNDPEFQQLLAGKEQVGPNK